MAPALSIYTKRRIVSLANLGNRYTTISKILLQEEDKKVSRQAVANTVHKFKKKNSLSASRKSDRKRIVIKEHLNFIDKSYDKSYEENAIETPEDEANVVMEDNENGRNVTVLEEQKIDFDVDPATTLINTLLQQNAELMKQAETLNANQAYLQALMHQMIGNQERIFGKLALLDTNKFMFASPAFKKCKDATNESGWRK